MDWEGIAIHHSASPDVSVNEIDKWHKERGWQGVGYHFVVRKNGNIEPGRSLEKQGAHAKGRNKTHIGVCLTGDFTKDIARLNQICSAVRLINGLMESFDIDKNKVEEHHGNCPGDNILNLIKSYIN